MEATFNSFVSCPETSLHFKTLPEIPLSTAETEQQMNKSNKGAMLERLIILGHELGSANLSS